MGKLSYRVLVVEPDGETATVIQQVLQQNAHSSERAEDGRVGLFMAASERFDVMVCERFLPGDLDGLKLVQTLRSKGNSIEGGTSEVNLNVIAKRVLGLLDHQ